MTSPVSFLNAVPHFVKQTPGFPEKKKCYKKAFWKKYCLSFIAEVIILLLTLSQATFLPRNTNVLVLFCI